MRFNNRTSGKYETPILVWSPYASSSLCAQEVKQVNRAQRLFGPRSKRIAAQRETVRRDVDPVTKRLVQNWDQDAETAERSAQNIALVLKRALRRRIRSSSTSSKPSAEDEY